MVISVSRSQAKENNRYYLYIGYQTQELTVTSGKAFESYNEGRCTGYGRSRSHGYTSKARKTLQVL